MSNPTKIDKDKLDDKWLRPGNPKHEEALKAWREHGGEIHGPNVETVTMPEEKFYIFLDSFRRDVANKLCQKGIKPTFSTGICGSTTCGYGDLDEYGYWEFPLGNPEEFLAEIIGKRNLNEVS